MVAFSSYVPHFTTQLTLWLPIVPTTSSIIEYIWTSSISSIYFTRKRIEIWDLQLPYPIKLPWKPHCPPLKFLCDYWLLEIFTIFTWFIESSPLACFPILLSYTNNNDSISATLYGSFLEFIKTINVS